MWLHRYAIFVAAATVLLIVAGGLVTSTGSGLSVPDWPTTYGWSMFTFPLDKMVGGIFYEHSHRLIATSVGMLTIGLAVWLWLAESRRWLRRLGLVALGVICAQGLLGGVTVLFFLPATVSIAHAGLAQIFFCVVVSIAVLTSRSWETTAVAKLRLKPPSRSPRQAGEPSLLGGRTAAAKLRQLLKPRTCFIRKDTGFRRCLGPLDDRLLRIMASATTAAIYGQILVGATMRHTDAGLAIPDFPLVFGGLVPPQWTARIAIHYAHRVGALIIASAILAMAAHIRYHHQSRPELIRPATVAALLVLAQVALGGLTVLSGRAVSINTAHVATGALLLATSLVISLRSWRIHFARSESTLATEFPPAGDLARTRPSVGAQA